MNEFTFQNLTTNDVTLTIGASEPVLSPGGSVTFRAVPDTITGFGISDVNGTNLAERSQMSSTEMILVVPGPEIITYPAERAHIWEWYVAGIALGFVMMVWAAKIKGFKQLVQPDRGA